MKDNPRFECHILQYYAAYFNILLVEKLINGSTDMKQLLIASFPAAASLAQYISVLNTWCNLDSGTT